MNKYFTNFRKIIYLILGALDSVTGRKPGIFILCYHSIDNDKWMFSVSLSNFEKQMKFLANKYQFIGIESLINHVNGKEIINKPSVLITFDDGYKSVINAKNVIKNLDIKPVVFLIANNKNPNYKELEIKKDFLNKKDVLTLLKENWKFGSHTATHSNLLKLSRKEIEFEIRGSKRILEKDLGIEIDYIAYPKGKYDDNVLKAVKESGYKLAMTMNDAEINQQTKLLEIPRIGVDGTHTFDEFKVLANPTVSLFRKIVKPYMP